MSTATYPETMPQPQKPKSQVGCILLGIGGGCLVLLLVCGGLTGMGIFGLAAAFKTSEPYTKSLQHAKQNAELQSEIGQPIDAGVMVQGNINLNNDAGEANITYAVSGSDGSATVHVVAKKTDGSWEYEQVSATTSDGTVIDLMETKESIEPGLIEE